MTEKDNTEHEEDMEHFKGVQPTFYQKKDNNMIKTPRCLRAMNNNCNICSIESYNDDLYNLKNLDNNAKKVRTLYCKQRTKDVHIVVNCLVDVA